MLARADEQTVVRKGDVLGQVLGQQDVELESELAGDDRAVVAQDTLGGEHARAQDLFSVRDENIVVACVDELQGLDIQELEKPVRGVSQRRVTTVSRAGVPGVPIEQIEDS